VKLIFVDLLNQVPPAHIAIPEDQALGLERILKDILSNNDRYMTIEYSRIRKKIKRRLKKKQIPAKD
jgi:hypothetical protein